MNQDHSVNTVNLPHIVQKEPFKPLEVISRRDYFAAMAMQGLLANSEFLRNYSHIDIHQAAIMNANYLIAALDQKGEDK